MEIDMDVPIDVKVQCSDGDFGKSTAAILRPNNEEITHLVVSDNGFPTTEHLVPVDQIMESSPDHIMLKCTRDDLSQMPIFDKMEFIPSDLSVHSGSPYMMWPYYTAASTMEIENQHIPVDELAIRRGSKVEAADGHVGRVDEFLISPENNITHLIMREGHLWGKKEVTIPVNEIDHFIENTVFLKLSKQDIERLPTIPVRRSRDKVR
jgi:hypothetical protein